MSYLVLARKYRPQTFGQVVGQGHVTKTLANAFKASRVHHAFLLCGPRGVGKTTLARILGKALNCEKGPTPEPCGTCAACVSIADGSAVDYREMDGASNRGIDAIRELTEAVRYQPAVLRKKVYVVDEVHMLTTEAFNALLKTLEEPPPHITFVMATTEPQKLPNTILSRCQRYDFKLVPSSALGSHLRSVFEKESVEAEAGAISLLVSESGGSVRDALSLADQIISYVGEGAITEQIAAEVLGVADRALTRSLIEDLSVGNVAGALTRADSAIARGVNENQIARALLRYLRDLSMLQVVGKDTGLVDFPPEERASMSEFAKTLSGERLRRFSDRLLRACDDLALSVYPRLVLDHAFIDLAAMDSTMSAGELVNRLEEMEARLATGARDVPATGLLKESATQAAVSQPPARPSMREAAVDAPKVKASAPPKPAPALEQPVKKHSSQSSSETSSKGPRAVPNDLLAGWAEVIKGLEEAREIPLAGLYQQARMLEWNKERIKVAFPEDTASSELAVEPEKLEEMSKFLAQHLGYSVKFDVVLLSPKEMEKFSDARSIVEARDEAARSEKEQREREAREHPATKMVESAFGSTPTEVKTNV